MSDADPMDQRLREYAARWRDAGAPPPAPDAVRLGSGRRGARTWWLAAATAAAVAAVILGGTQLVGDGGSRKPSEPAGTPRPTGTARPSNDVVPWAALPATHPRIPTETTPPSPDPAEAAGRPACRAADLHATSTGGPAGGTYYSNVMLTLAGSQPCRLEGYPDVLLLHHGRPVDIPLNHGADTAYRNPVLVAAGHPALVRLSWTGDWCATPVENDEIRMTLPGGSLTLPGLGSSSCYGTPGSGSRAPIVVEPFQPMTWRDARVRSAYAHVDVAGDLNLTAASGAPVDFTITLTSPADLVLELCPDYRITQNGPNGPSAETYALNCAAVPYQDGHGRPYLPAGTPVTFAMRTTAGLAGGYKLGWELATVDARGVTGTLIVTSDQGSPATPRTRDDALRAALAADPFVRREMIGAPPQGPVECALHVLGSSASGQTLYLWLGCADFVVANGSAKARAGSHEPAVVQVRGSGADLQIVKVTFPRQQSLAADIARLFPPSIASHIYDEKSAATSPSSEELAAEAVRDATG